MILTRLHGGTGNQLFQYAAGRALALRLGTDLGLDVRRLDQMGLRLARAHFDWQVVDAAVLPPDQRDRPVAHALWRAFGRSPHFHRERVLGFNPGFETWGDGSYLHGYWQSERYFAAYADTLRRDLRIVTPASAQNAEMARQIADSLSVSLHVRRGDYLQSGAYASCSGDYYRAALHLVAEAAGITPRIFVFSDDPAWAQDNLDLPFAKVVVDFNGRDTDYEDLRLMSLCRHNIIANSSFSWWGAWLNTHPGKVVVAPKRWFAARHLQNPDLLPEGWLSL